MDFFGDYLGWPERAVLLRVGNQQSHAGGIGGCAGGTDQRWLLLLPGDRQPSFR